jgi:hypothetical protein
MRYTNHTQNAIARNGRAALVRHGRAVATVAPRTYWLAACGVALAACGVAMALAAMVLA